MTAVLCIITAALLTLLAGLSPSHAASVYLSPAGDDTKTCIMSAPCRSLQRGYQVALPGQIIEMADGSYTSQAISGTKASPPVVFQPAAQARVFISQLDINATNLELRDLAIGSWKTRSKASFITLRNVKSNWFGIQSSANVSLIGGEVVPSQIPVQTDYDPHITEEPGSGIAPTNILIDGVAFHDWLRPAGSDFHVECLQVGAGVNVIIRNSRFWNCATHDIFIRSWGTINGGVHALRNWTIENNFFGMTPNGFYALSVGNDLGMANGKADFLIRNNTFLQSVLVDGPTTVVSMINNIVSYQASWTCTAAIYSHNIYETFVGTGSQCGATDRVTPIKYLDRATLDLRLTLGSPAIDTGDPASYPTTDIYGQSRPAGSAPDIGAHEFRDASAPPPASTPLPAPTGLIVR